MLFEKTTKSQSRIGEKEESKGSNNKQNKQNVNNKQNKQNVNNKQSKQNVNNDKQNNNKQNVKQNEIKKVVNIVKQNNKLNNKNSDKVKIEIIKSYDQKILLNKNILNEKNNNEINLNNSVQNLALNNKAKLRYNTIFSDYNCAIVQSQLKFYNILITSEYLIKCISIPQGSLFSQQMEILGDSLINYISVKYILRKNPKYNEGQITRYKIILVNKFSLSILAKKLNLDLLCSNKKSVYLLSSLLEALFGGYSLIQSNDKLELSYLKLMKDCWCEIISNEMNMDYKSVLQSLTQKYYKIMPLYQTSLEKNQKTLFISYCRLGNITTQAIFNNKKGAEQKAAKIMMLYLNINFLLYLDIEQ